MSTFLCNEVSNDILKTEKPELDKKINITLAEKLQVLQLEPNSIFPFNEELSAGIDIPAFNTSFLIQPDVFIRIRPRKTEVVVKKLAEAQIEFKEISGNTIAVPSGSKLDEILQLNKEAVIQDLNSQRVGELLQEAIFTNHPKVWDCCAASGGKSIMVEDLLANIDLTVSDVRQSIIQNLKKRFADAGIKNYASFVADITNGGALKNSLGNQKFDLIICDAPCSGSGTWARTPEQLLFFKQEEITRYSNLQKSIASNTFSYVKKGGYLLYITCSVFAKENEEVVEFIQRQSNLQLLTMKLLKGYQDKADTMFAALFRLVQ